jgi:hypothetical protein
MKIPEFKRSGIGIIAEFRGIPNRFPNQAEDEQLATCKTPSNMVALLVNLEATGNQGFIANC